MKINEVLLESENIDEVLNIAQPKGFWSTVTDKALAAVGSGKAAGRLQTGQVANQLWKEFSVYLGKTGKGITRGTVLAFLKSKRFPTIGAEKILTSKAGAAQAPLGAAGPAAGGAQANKRTEPTMDTTALPAVTEQGIGAGTPVDAKVAKAAILKAASDSAALATTRTRQQAKAPRQAAAPRAATQAAAPAAAAPQQNNFQKVVSMLDTLDQTELLNIVQKANILRK